MTNLPELPPGAVLLTADEAIHALVTTDHADAYLAARRGAELDVTLAGMIRSGEVVAARLADGRLVFTLAEEPPL